MNQIAPRVTRHFVAVAHVAFRASVSCADGTGYRWLPVNYSANR